MGRDTLKNYIYLASRASYSEPVGNGKELRGRRPGLGAIKANGENLEVLTR